MRSPIRAFLAAGLLLSAWALSACGSKEAASCARASCNDHGVCAGDVSAPRCTCDRGYTGANCERCTTASHRDGSGACVANAACTPDACGAHGTCDDASGVVTCACAEGFAGATCATCAAGFHDDGAGSCVLDQQCLSTSCSGEGTCSVVAGAVQCACDAGFSGAACESCATAYHRDAAGLCVADQSCTASNPCSAHGTCVEAGGVLSCLHSWLTVRGLEAFPS